MSASSVDSIIEGFPHPSINRHTGVPTFEAIYAVHELISANASSVPSKLGGGAHGHLGLTISKQHYLTLTSNHFDKPTDPGPSAAMPPGYLSEAQTAKFVSKFEEAKQIWLEYDAIDKALQKQLLSAFEEIYFEAKKDMTSGYSNLTTKDLIDHLYLTYGDLTPEKLKSNEEQKMQPFNGYLPIEQLFVRIEAAMKIADAGGKPYTPHKIVSKAYDLVYETGLYNDACEEWSERPKAEHTWPKFKKHFTKAYIKMKDQEATKQRDSFDENSIGKNKRNSDTFNSEPSMKAAAAPPRGLGHKSLSQQIHDANAKAASKFEKTIKNFKKKIKQFYVIKIAQLICVIYILVLTFSKAPMGLVDPETGDIIDTNYPENTEKGLIYVNGDYRAVVAEGTLQMICLAISRMSAFSLYPVMIAVFLTKCRATISFLDKIHLSVYLNQDNHELHVYAGRYIAIDVWIHTFFHLLRWGLQGNISLLWKNKTGLSGLIVVVATPFITMLMMSERLKKRIRYEIRKSIHYLFYVFAVGLCFHAPVSGIPNGGFIAPVLGFCICLYTLDAIYVYIFMTEKIDTTIFHVLPSGVQMTMAVSESFQRRMGKGGFAYVCLPWVDKNQWHAFSLFEDPTNNQRKQVFMLKTGDWTTAVHDALQRNTVRPMWISGPFVSPYNNSILYDNQILVASGIGITPALSVINAHKDTRRVNLVWACRDAAMLEFYLEHMIVDNDGWNLIFYTGKSALNPALEELNTNVRIIKGRPDLNDVLPNIIYGIESGIGLPETYVPTERERVKGLVADEMIQLESRRDLTERQKQMRLSSFAQSQGYLLQAFVDQIGESKRSSAHLSNSNHSNLEIDLDILDEESSETDSEAASDSEEWGERCAVLKSTHNLKRRSNLNRQISSVLESTFQPWEYNIKAGPFVKNLDKTKVLNTWGVMYCGGSKIVEKTLKNIAEEYKINLNTESFAW